VTKVLILGLDGATWNLLKPLMNQGKLPILKKLIKNGCSGELESCIPHITFPAWKCYSTGKNPGKLGVFGFTRPDFNRRRFVYNNSQSFRSCEYWDYLGKFGFKCVIVGMPTTYPPKRVNGCMVCEFTSKDTGYTYLPNLEIELKNKFNYKPNQTFSFKTNPDKAIVEARELIGQRFDVAKYLAKKYNFYLLNLTIFQIDDIQHFAWKYWENFDEKYGNILEEFWIIIDEKIKELLEEFMNDDLYVFLLSDHGFTRIDGRFNLCEWLIRKGYLKLNRKIQLLRLLYRMGINKELVLIMIEKTKLRGILQKVFPYTILQKGGILPTKEGYIHDTTELEKIIDWNNSKVIITPIGDGLIYLNPRIFKKGTKEYESFRSKLIKELENEIHPKTGKKLAKKVFKKEEAYTGEYLDEAPDIIILPNEGHHIPVTFSFNSEVWIETDSTTFFSANHELYGIFIAYGPGIKKGYEIKGAKIYDIAPTILHIFGLPIPNDMDGRVLTEIFEPDSELAKRKPVYVDPSYYEKIDEKEKLKNKIKDLKLKGKI
jgi:predicted AlkP superfamily phosphohydrolase/phosphomutase